MNWSYERIEKECPFCKTYAKVSSNTDTGQLLYTDCLCGKFIIDQISREDTSYRNILKTDEDKILFSGYLRNNQSSQKNNQLITITEEFIRDELQGILDYCKRKTLDEKISEIKRYIYQKTTTLEESVPIKFDKLYTLFYLKSSQELRSIIKHLRDTEILYANANLGGPTANVFLTIESFSKVEANLKDFSQSRNVFIACEFGTPYEDNLVKTIMAACAACGFDAKRVKDERHDKDITHKIIADIKQSRFIIADFTGQNNGVYYEAGYAMGMSKKVIRLVNEEQFNELHFDTRQFPHMPWKKDKWDDLKEDLIDQIKATILNNNDKTE